MTEGVVWLTSFLAWILFENAVAMATIFSALKYIISCTSTYHYGPMYPISNQLVKKWGSSMIHNILYQFYLKMLWPWQRNSRLWWKWYLALIHINMDLCSKFQINWSITEGVVWSTKISHRFHLKNAVAMATWFSTLTKNISCISIHHYGPMY